MRELRETSVVEEHRKGRAANPSLFLLSRVLSLVVVDSVFFVFVSVFLVPFPGSLQASTLHARRRLRRLQLGASRQHLGEGDADSFNDRQ